MPSAREQRAQAVGFAGLGGLGDAEKQLGDLASRPAALTADSAAMACASVSAVPPDFEVTTKRVVGKIESVEPACSVAPSRLS